MNVDAILRPYKEIAGYEAQAAKWDRDFNATYGVDWSIRIDLRGGKVASAGGHFPTALYARGEGDYGFTANFGSSSVSVINLKTGVCEAVPETGTIPVGENPLRIAVQPMYSLGQISKAIQTGLQYAEPEDFTEPPKQPVLLRDWDAVAELELTHAAPQAVLANVEIFACHAEQWVTDTALRADLAHLATLYRAQHGKENP